jgi:hypothetical protein
MENGNLTVKAAHELKRALEEKIDAMLVEFEQHTGLEIDSLRINTINPNKNSVGFKINVSLPF